MLDGYWQGISFVSGPPTKWQFFRLSNLPLRLNILTKDADLMTIRAVKCNHCHIIQPLSTRLIKPKFSLSHGPAIAYIQASSGLR